MSAISNTLTRRRKTWAVGARDGWRCRYCTHGLTIETATLDHWLPASRGGSNDLANLVLACRPCNGEKASMTGEEFLGLADEALRRMIRSLELAS